MSLMRHTAAVIFISAFLVLVSGTGIASATDGDAGIEQYVTASTDQQTTSQEPQESTTQEAGSTGADPAVEYVPVAVEAVPSSYAPAAVPPDSGNVTAAPAAETPPATAGMTSKAFMILGSAAAAVSMVASGLSIFRGRS